MPRFWESRVSVPENRAGFRGLSLGMLFSDVGILQSDDTGVRQPSRL